MCIQDMVATFVRLLNVMYYFNRIYIMLVSMEYKGVGVKRSHFVKKHLLETRTLRMQ
jgi:hypothetical protein